jgi:hypothetical protein
VLNLRSKLNIVEKFQLRIATYGGLTNHLTTYLRHRLGELIPMKVNGFHRMGITLIRREY